MGARTDPTRRGLLGLALLLAARWAAALAGGLLLFPIALPAPGGEPARAGGDPGAAPPAGRWRKRVPPPTGGPLSEEQRALVERLEAIGYLSGSTPAPSERGVTIHDAGRAFPGLNFYVSGHAPEALLMDMKGEVLHRWSYDFSAALPDFRLPRGHRGDAHWRRAHLFANGDVLAIYEGFALIRVDRNSKRLWTYQGRPHHDLDVTEDGRIFVLTRHAAWKPDINPEKPVLEDFIAVLSPEGRELRRVSLLEAYRRSPFASQLERMDRSGDLFHTNTIEVLDGSHADLAPAFRKGNALISILQMDAVAVVDMESETVVWSMVGAWDKQHQPTFTESGHLLLFDNRRDLSADSSRVVEIDPLTHEIVWEYSGRVDGPLRSRSCGSVQRLPNGNTLITESDNGRAFEVTADKTIVWEYVSPHRAGRNGEYVATLFDLVRLPPDFPLDWRDDPAPQSSPR